MMIEDDNDGQMIFGDLGGLKLPDICLTGEEELRKNLTQETCPDRGSNPGRCVTGAYATAWPTAVDVKILRKFTFNIIINWLSIYVIYSLTFFSFMLMYVFCLCLFKGYTTRFNLFYYSVIP